MASSDEQFSHVAVPMVELIVDDDVLPLTVAAVGSTYTARGGFWLHFWYRLNGKVGRAHLGMKILTVLQSARSWRTNVNDTQKTLTSSANKGSKNIYGAKVQDTSEHNNRPQSLPRLTL